MSFRNAEAHSSWSLTLNVQRISSAQTGRDVGAQPKSRRWRRGGSFLARPIVKEDPSWQKAQRRLTLQRVRQSL